MAASRFFLFPGRTKHLKAEGNECLLLLSTLYVSIRKQKGANITRSTGAQISPNNRGPLVCYNQIWSIFGIKYCRGTCGVIFYLLRFKIHQPVLF